MYGLDKDGMFWDKFGLSFLFIMMHCIVCGMVMLFFCLLFTALKNPYIGVYLGVFFCGFMTFPFVFNDLKDIWKI